MEEFTSGEEYREEHLAECVQQAVKFGGGSVMVWGCISCDGMVPLAKIDGRMKGKDYIDLLCANLLHTCSQWDQNTLLWMTMPLAIEPM